jgi:hypothetical protein
MSLSVSVPFAAAQDRTSPTVTTGAPTAEATRLLRERLGRASGVVVDLTPAEASMELRRPLTPVMTDTPAYEDLQPGMARFVTLNSADEEQTRQMVRYMLPDAFRGQAAVFDGVVQTVDTDRRELTLKAVAFPRAPLRLNPSTGRFEGALSVGVIEVDGKRSRTLSAPIAFQVLGPVTADPDPVSTDRTAPPYKEVRIFAEAPDPQVDVTVVSNVTPAGEKLTLRVRPSMGVRVSPASIQGWGLETANVLVRAQGYAGGGTQVQLSTSLGRLSDNRATLDDSGMAQVSIRSESVGTGTVSAAGAGLDGATVDVVYDFPWRFLGAALLGGIVGGLLRKRSRAGGTDAVVKSLGIAVLSAAVVVGLYVLGINVVGFALPTHGGEVLVFVVAALGALYGTKLLAAQPTTSI